MFQTTNQIIYLGKLLSLAIFSDMAMCSHDITHLSA